MYAILNLKGLADRFPIGNLAFVLICLAATILPGCGRPPVPPHPYWGSYETETGVTEAARQWSASLEQYIRDWMDGRVPAEIPPHLIPESQCNNSNSHAKEPLYNKYLLR
jgi:hypothetical protein